jgi:hypothetical protein
LQRLLLQALLADQNHALQGFEKCRLVPIGEACVRRDAPRFFTAFRMTRIEEV